MGLKVNKTIMLKYLPLLRWESRITEVSWIYHLWFSTFTGWTINQNIENRASSRFKLAQIRSKGKISWRWDFWSLWKTWTNPQPHNPTRFMFYKYRWHSARNACFFFLRIVGSSAMMNNSMLMMIMQGKIWGIELKRHMKMSGISRIVTILKHVNRQRDR